MKDRRRYSVTSKRSTTAACKVAGHLTGCELHVHAPGGPGAAQVGGRADLQASGSPIAAVQIDWQVTGLGRTKRGASGTSKIDGCQPGHGVRD